VARPDYVNAGKLYPAGFVGGERVYVCPTVQANSGGRWFHAENPWPVSRRYHTTMTYGTRRMRNYDEPALANQRDHYDTRDDHIMIWSTGVQGIEQPSRFSFMADSFRMPSAALKSHAPGVNVQYLDGHVAYWEDRTDGQQVLYDNGLPYDSWDPVWNWWHDDIWMIIDRYHEPPVGQRKARK
jgi:prepilin-type processing-associated H-X9-DG protein